MQAIGRSFRNLWVIFSHEFKLFFVSPFVYIIAMAWIWLAGIAFSFFFSNMNTGQQEPSMSGTISFLTGFVMLMTAPALTMRLIAEELNGGTHELLFTAPVRDWEVVVGKWLAAWAVATCFMLLLALFALFLVLRGNPDPGLMLANFLGLWLIAGATLSIGVFTSSLSKYQVVAFFVGLILTFVLYYINLASVIIPNQTLSDVISHMALRTHQDKLIQQGVIDWTDVAYYVGIISIFLFLGTQVLASRRWRS